MKCADCPFSYAWGGCHFDRDEISPCELVDLAGEDARELLRFVVYEEFPDGKMYELKTFADPFDARVWARNHADCTPALYNGRAKLSILFHIEVWGGDRYEWRCYQI